VQEAANPPDWDRIDTVLLDMDGTVLDLEWDMRFWRDTVPRRFAAQHGVTLDEARRTVYPLFQSVHGTLDWYCIEFWSRRLQLDIAAMKRALRHELAWLPQAREFIGRLRAEGRRVVLVTNAHPGTLEIKDAQLGLRRHFDAMHSSHPFGAAKEHAEFWPRLAEREPFDRQRTLFVDDSLPVLQAARAHGIEWVYAIRRPVSYGPAREMNGFPAVDFVHELSGAARAPVAATPGMA